MKGVLAKVTSHLCRRLRCIIWKMWKIPRYRIVCLRKLSVSENEAKKLAYSRKEYWNTSKTPVLHLAISNKRLKQKGLVFPLDYYLSVHI